MNGSMRVWPTLMMEATRLRTMATVFCFVGWVRYWKSLCRYAVLSDENNLSVVSIPNFFWEWIMKWLILSTGRSFSCRAGELSADRAAHAVCVPPSRLGLFCFASAGRDGKGEFLVWNRFPIEDLTSRLRVARSTVWKQLVICTRIRAALVARQRLAGLGRGLPGTSSRRPCRL